MTFTIGTRVRVVRGETMASKIAAGKEGVVVEYEAQQIPLLEAFPIAVMLDGGDHAQVWHPSELVAMAIVKT